MCKFKSFVVTKTKIYYSNKTDSHSEILQEHGLQDSDLVDGFVPVELSPHNCAFVDVAAYKFVIDWPTDRLPKWFVADKLERECRKILKAVIKKNVFEGSLDLSGTQIKMSDVPKHLKSKVTM